MIQPSRLFFGFVFACAAFGQGGFNGPGTYEITNFKSGKVIDLDRNDQTTVIQFSSRGTDNQTWYIQNADSGFYFIRNGMNGNAMTATGGNASPLQGRPFTGDASQQWSIENGKDGNAIISNRQGKAFDVPDGTNRDGVRLQIYDRNGDSNQRFTFRQVQGSGRSQPGWMGNQRNQTSGGASIRCSSDDGGRHYCNADTRAGVQMVRQISGTQCIQNQTWGFDNRGIWVDRGCRAEFQVNANSNRNSGGYNQGNYNQGNNSNGANITCGSDDGSRRYCDADTRNGMQLVRQLSGSPCTQGQTWGFDNRGVWVDRGCRAEFQTGGGGGSNGGFASGQGGVITCSSDDGRKHYCDADTRSGGVQLTRQISGTSCVQGQTWGFDARGIWVDRGCRAEFQVNAGGRRRYNVQDDQRRP